MRERIVRFGPQNNLVGIVTTPANTQQQAPAVIILNSGAMHRVGACRVSVILARTLAADGHPVLRFDFSGVGDSTARGDDVEPDDRSVVEVLEAMDFLNKEMQCEQFVLHGLCSGARDAFEAALRDERIVGISQIDSHAYQNMRWYINYYGERMLDLSVWKEYVKKHLLRLLSRSAKSQHSDTDENLIVVGWPALPPRKQIEDGYRLLVARGVKFYVVFTGSWNFAYNYANQFFDMYSKVNFGNSIDLRFLPDTNHILTEPIARLAVIGGCRDLLRTLRDDTKNSSQRCAVS